MLAVVFLVGVAACGGDIPEVEATVSSAPSEPTTDLGSDRSTEPGDQEERVDPASLPEAEPVLPRVVTFADAEAAYHGGSYGEAMDLFGVYTGDKPDNPWGHYMLGLAAWKAGHLEEAETALGESVRLDPNHVKGHVNLARVLLETGDIARAVEHATVAEDIDPASVQAKRTLARALSESGDTPGAIAMYERALWIDPEDTWSLNNLGYLLIQRGEFDEAVGPLALAVTLNAGNAVFRNNLGSALEGAGHVVAAARAFSGAAELDADHEKAVASASRLAELVDGDAAPEVDLVAVAESFRGRLAGAATDEAPKHGEGIGKS